MSAGGGVSGGCLTAIVEAMNDAQTAVRFLRANASTYGIDPSRIAIGGSSAGAITALNVAFNADNIDTTGSYQGYQASVPATSSIGQVEWSGPIIITDAYVRQPASPDVAAAYFASFDN